MNSTKKRYWRYKPEKGIILDERYLFGKGHNQTDVITHLLILVITLIGGCAAFCFSKFVLPLQYSSHISMYVQSYTGISENNNNVNNISNSKQLVNTYMEVLKDDAVMNAVGDLLIEQYPSDVLGDSFAISEENRINPNSIRNCLAISSVTDTSAV